MDLAGIALSVRDQLQGGREEHEIQVALAEAPEVRQKLHDKVG
jgi:hypothetical protein